MILENRRNAFEKRAEAVILDNSLSGN